MKNLLKVKWSILSYLGTNLFMYLIIAFVKLDINFLLWEEGTRLGLIVFGILISIGVISAIWIFGEE